MASASRHQAILFSISPTRMSAWFCRSPAPRPVRCQRQRQSRIILPKLRCAAYAETARSSGTATSSTSQRHWRVKRLPQPIPRTANGLSTSTADTRNWSAAAPSNPDQMALRRTATPLYQFKVLPIWTGLSLSRSHAGHRDFGRGREPLATRSAVLSPTPDMGATMHTSSGSSPLA